MTKILVIEDDPHIRESIVDTLEYIDYEIAEAKNGVEGVAERHVEVVAQAAEVVAKAGRQVERAGHLVN